ACSTWIVLWQWPICPPSRAVLFPPLGPPRPGAACLSGGRLHQRGPWARRALRAHAGRGIDGDDLAAAQGYGEHNTSGTTADLEEEVLGPYVGREDRQVGVQWAVRISAKTPRNRPSPGVGRWPCTVQARPLCAHGIDAGSVGFSSSHRVLPPCRRASLA